MAQAGTGREFYHKQTPAGVHGSQRCTLLCSVPSRPRFVEADNGGVVAGWDRQLSGPQIHTNTDPLPTVTKRFILTHMALDATGWRCPPPSGRLKGQRSC